MPERRSDGSNDNAFMRCLHNCDTQAVMLGSMMLQVPDGLFWIEPEGKLAVGLDCRVMRRAAFILTGPHTLEGANLAAAMSVRRPRLQGGFTCILQASCVSMS